MQIPQAGAGGSRADWATANFEALSALHDRANRRYFQLEPGEPSGRMRVVNLGGVQVIREQLPCGVHLLAEPEESLLPWAVVLKGSDPLRFCGVEHRPDQVVQATGSEWDARTPGNFDYLFCAVDAELFERATIDLYQSEPGAECFQSRLRDVRADRLSELTRTLLTANSSALTLPAAREALAAEVVRRLLRTLTDTDTRERTDTRMTRRRAIRKAREYMLDNPAERPSISTLCALTGVSERTLEYGFREEFRVTPLAYLKLIRLNGVRTDLLTDYSSSGVTETANSWGFTELGRFAGEYRKLFGELPSQTMAGR